MPQALSEASVLEYLSDLGSQIEGFEASGARCEPAGDGNINWVRRVRSGERSWVVKQAGPALERFPEYRVSPERILHEARYWEIASRFDVGRICPQVLHLDAERHVLVLEDLAPAVRFDRAFERRFQLTLALEEIAAFLGRVHAGTRDAALRAGFPDGESDDGVLRLHLDHIFRVPFEANDFPLAPVVRATARELAEDGDFHKTRQELDARCRRRGDALIHGDVQPTNLLIRADGPKLLDAETAHSGDPALELGILFAHLLIDGIAQGDPPAPAGPIRAMWRFYRGDDGAMGEPEGGFDTVARLAGIEMIRRAIGAARVPSLCDTRNALAALRIGRALVVDGASDPIALRALN